MIPPPLVIAIPNMVPVYQLGNKNSFEGLGVILEVWYLQRRLHPKIIPRHYLLRLKS